MKNMIIVILTLAVICLSAKILMTKEVVAKKCEVQIESKNNDMFEFELYKDESYELGNLIIVDNTNEDYVIIKLNQDLGK